MKEIREPFNSNNPSSEEPEEMGFGCPECGAKPPYHYPTCSRYKEAKKEISKPKEEIEKEERTPEQQTALTPPSAEEPEEPLAEVVDFEEYRKRKEEEKEVIKKTEEEKPERILDKIQNPHIRKKITDLVGQTTESLSYLLPEIKSGNLEKIQQGLQRPFYQNLIKKIYQEIFTITEPSLQKLSQEAFWQEIDNYFTKKSKFAGIQDPELIKKFVENSKAAIEKALKKPKR